MPNLTGPQLAERLAPLRPDMQVLFVSGYRHDQLSHAGMAREANILSKPFPGHELLRRVRTLLRETKVLAQ
jgi:DNA-binding response OmpR family regulator